MDSAVDLAAVLATFAEPWSPRTVATMNDYDVRVVKTRGEFTWHSHPETDELFLVLKGSLTIRLEAGEDVVLEPGQVFVVPNGGAAPAVLGSGRGGGPHRADRHRQHR